MTTRRRLLAAGAGVALGGGNRRSTRAQDDRPPLRILGWGHYFSESIIAGFEESSGFRIEVTSIGAPDDVALFLRAGGLGLYDLVTPASGLVIRMGEEGLIEPLDLAAIPAVSELYEPFRAPVWVLAENGQLAVPLVWGSLAAVVPLEAAGSAPANWTDLFGDQYAKKVVMSDDALGHFWIWNRALGAEDPTRVTRAELTATADALISMKQSQATVWESSVYGAIRRLARGRGLVASVGWQIAPLLVEPGERELVVSHPEPGDASFCDCLAVVSGGPQREAAHALIDYLISAGPQSALANETKWATVNSGAVGQIEPQIAGLVGYGSIDTVLQRSPIRGYPPFSAEGDMATYLDWTVAWDRVRSTRVGG